MSVGDRRRHLDCSQFLYHPNFWNCVTDKFEILNNVALCSLCLTWCNVSAKSTKKIVKWCASKYWITFFITPPSGSSLLSPLHLRLDRVCCPHFISSWIVLVVPSSSPSWSSLLSPLHLRLDRVCFPTSSSYGSSLLSPLHLPRDRVCCPKLHLRRDRVYCAHFISVGIWFVVPLHLRRDRVCCPPASPSGFVIPDWTNLMVTLFGGFSAVCDGTADVFLKLRKLIQIYVNYPLINTDKHCKRLPNTAYHCQTLQNTAKHSNTAKHTQSLPITAKHTHTEQSLIHWI